MDKLYDLKLILSAIKAVRKRWLEAIKVKQVEILVDRPSLDTQEAHCEALMNSEVQREYQNLISLYGVIGNEAAEYESALEPVVVKPTVKKAA